MRHDQPEMMRPVLVLGIWMHVKESGKLYNFMIYNEKACQLTRDYEMSLKTTEFAIS